MANTITQSLAGGVMRSFSLMEAFIKACPDNIWNAPYGKWPVGQQVLHAFGAVDFFLRGPEEKEAQSPFSEAIISLKEVPANAPAKEAVSAFMSECKARVEAYVASLDDAKLAEKHEGLSKRLGADMTHAATLSLIGSHNMYHLGSADAALRQNNLPGVF
ncbi:DinB family protein [Desulfovibrio sp. OttesenSCG-928-G15]|nr:DinB family protein [Desulfovibrio sp. OttesenSCG-928-G15]